MKRTYCCILWIIILLTGCGRAAGTGHPQGSAAEMSVAPGEETVSYEAETWDAGITPEFQPLSDSFVQMGDMLYYVDKIDGQPMGINGVSLTGPGQPVQQFLRLEPERIEALASAHGTDGEAILALAGREVSGAPFLAAYTLDGRQLWRQSYEEQEQTVLSLVQDDSGYFYAMFMDQVLLFDTEGMYQGGIPCPGRNYIDICPTTDDKVYVTYQDGQESRVVLAQLQYQGQKLTGEIRIPGRGHLGVGREGTLLLRDKGEIYTYTPQNQEATVLLSLTTYDLVGDQIQAMAETASGEILLISWETLEYSRPVQITRLRETAAGQPTTDGKQEITWLVVGLPDLYEPIVAEFNQQSRDYRVVLEPVSLKGLTITDGTSAYDINSGIFMCVNTRLLASESADLISFMSYQDMERYLEKGYLEDLSPYIAQSEEIKREDYREQVLECYMQGDALYSITPVFCIETLMGKASEMGAEPGWTVEEFLNWLSEHPDAVSQEGLSKENILTFCLMGTLDEYVDRESGQCHFDGEAFRWLMQRIYGLETDSASHWGDWEKQLEEKKPVLEQYRAAAFGECRSMENRYGEALVYKGYPSTDGTPCYFYTGDGLGILSRSTCKEGAYAFWEYYLLNVFNHDQDYYYTNKKDFAESMAHAADEQYAYNEKGEMMYRSLSDVQSGVTEDTDEWEWISYMTEEQCDKQLAMLEHVRRDTLEHQIIRSIILEEASYYFADVKNLEDTCQVIQSRVQLYLSETS